jgi:pimeloyl-ACP methyl ester carboxylesterase
VKDIVVLVPGILGSVFRRNGQIVWGYSARMIGTTLLTAGTRIRDNLILQNDGPDIDDVDDGITADALMPDLHLMPGFWKIDGYSAVSRTLCESFNLEPGRNYFEFPYDWRRDNTANAKRLAAAVNKWLADWRRTGPPDAKAVIVAHSMGGLIARYYLEVLGGWLEGPARALITIGTPFRGSLNALRTLVNGVTIGPVEMTALSEVCRSWTSTYQLLPIFPVYDPGDGALIRVSAASEIPHVCPARARSALTFHDEIRNAVTQNRRHPKWEEAGYGIYPIVGRTQLTDYIGRLEGKSLVMSRLYKGEDLGGDGTVPRVSAIPLEFDDQRRRGDMYATSKHGSLQNTRAVLDHVAGRINDLYTQFGDFRNVGVAAGEEIALETSDVLQDDEPLIVRARPGTPRSLTVMLYASRNEAPIRVLTLPPSDVEWVECRFEPLEEGSYRVMVTADKSMPVEEAIAVAAAPRPAANGAAS